MPTYEIPSQRFKVNRKILHQFHPISESLWSAERTVDENIPDYIKAIITKRPEEEYITKDITFVFTCEEQELKDRLTTFFSPKQDGQLFLDEEHFHALLGILAAYVEHEYQNGYAGGHIQNTLENTRSIDDALYDEARELLEALSNLLYMRDVYYEAKKNDKDKRKAITIKFECMQYNDKGQILGKDTDNSATLKGMYKPIFDAAIDMLFRDIQNASTYNNYLSNLFYRISKPPLQLTYESINDACEEFKPPDTGKKKVPENLFRGQLAETIGKYLDAHALIKLTYTTRNVFIYDMLAAFGLIEENKFKEKKTAKAKSDYVKGLPRTEGLELKATIFSSNEINPL